MMTLTRRHFLRTLGTGVLAAAATGPLRSLANLPKRPRPNILFIMADDHAPHGLSCYDSPILSTPNIDRLARQGMYYHYYNGYGIPEHYGVRTKTHKLLHFPTFRDGSYWELFDLTEDAEELTNVYTQPEYQAIAKKLHALLAAYEKKLKVPGKS